MTEFDFVADHQYRMLLVRDFLELKNCVENQASKSVLILSGSIIETLLLEFFTHNLPNGITKVQLLKKNLSELIDEAVDVGLISNKSKELSTVIKNYRNLIHPGREIRTNETFDQDTAIVSFSLVKIILKELKENYIQKYGYTAEDIFNKIRVDTSTYSIFEKLILKLNSHEKLRLLELLINFEIENYNSRDRSFHYAYIKSIKKNIENFVLLEYCKRLLKEVEKGETHTIFALFEIFGTDLNVLAEDEKNIILTYVYSKVNSVSAWNKNIENYRIRILFGFLPLYIQNPDFKQKFFDLLVQLVRSHKYTENTKWYYTSAFNDMILKFNEIEKQKIKEYISDKLSVEIADSFYKSLEEDTLPF